jgi:hypothetical protein
VPPSQESLLPATAAAQVRWLRIWESICAKGGTDREVADRMRVSERQIRLVRAAGRAGDFDELRASSTDEAAQPRALHAVRLLDGGQSEDEDWL